MENNKFQNRQRLVEMGYEESTVFENPDYDDAIIGVDTDGHVVYDFEKMVEHLMREDGMEYEDAVEFIEYNTIRALPYIPSHPIVMYHINED